MSKGFIILAHTKIDYLKMAYNLAVSMKFAGTKYPIAAITDLDPGILKDSSSKKAPKVFDEIIRLPDDLQKIKNRFPFYLKTRLPEMSPFEETVYFDADALFLKSPDFLFEMYKDFGMILNWKRPATTGEKRKTWAQPGILFDHYGFDKSGWFYDTNSSVIYFNRSDLAKEVFRLAEHYYAEDFYPKYYHEGFGHYPDELAFNTALANLQPELEENNPMRFMHSDSKRVHEELREILNDNCFGLYGNKTVTHKMLYRQYNRLVMDQGRLYHGFYGFKLNADSKVANGSDKRERYTGIREREKAI